MMRWLILAALVIAITAGVTVFLQSSPTETRLSSGPAFPVAPPSKDGPRPRVEIAGDTTYEFGTRAQFTTLARDWIIKNRGQGELTLKLEAPPCSCTVANFQGKDGKSRVSEIVVAPGDQIPIHFTWETRDNKGRYSKTATLLTDDPEQPKIVFKAEGVVQPAVVVLEPEIDLFEISTDNEDHKARVAVFSPDRPETQLLKMTSSKPGEILVEKQPLSEQDCKQLKIKAGYQVTVNVKRGMPLGSFREEVLLRTDHPKQPEVRIPVSGKMVGPISVVPERFVMHDVSSSTGGQRAIALLVRGRRATKFEVARKPEKFKVEITPGDNLPKVSKYLMTVTIPPGTPPGALEDEIVLKTDHPQARELRILVNVFVRDAG